MQSVRNKENPTDESTTCRFCGFFDPNFDEDALFMHFYKECPMVKFSNLIKFIIVNNMFQMQTDHRDIFSQLSSEK